MTSPAADISLSPLPWRAAPARGWSGAFSKLRAWAFVIVCAALVAGIGYKKPTHDWDMIAYVASALYDEGWRGDAWRDQVYAQVRADVNDHEYAQLVGHDPIATGQQIADYRAAVAGDPRALEQQLPFYRVKILYMALVKAAHRLGLPYVKATYAVSAAAAAAMAMAMVLGFLLISLRLPLFLLPAGLTAANICAFNNVAFGSLASQSTPDALASLYALVCLWLAARKDRSGLAAAALAPLARPDFIILSAALVAAILLTRVDENHAPGFPRLRDISRGKLVAGALSLAAAGAIYVAQNHFVGAYSFATLFNFSFMGFAPYPRSMNFSADPRDYLFAYLRAAKQTFESRHIVVYGLTLAALANPYPRALTRGRFTAVFALAPMAYVAIHVAVFPEYFDRFFSFAALATFLWLARLVVHRQRDGVARQPGAEPGGALAANIGDAK